MRRSGLRWAGLLLGIGVAAAASEIPQLAPGAPAPLQGAPGPMLRRALQALEAGDAARAEPLLVEIARAHPIVADHADLLRMRLLVDSGRLDDALAVQGTWAYLESPLESDFFSLVGLAHAERGDEIAARSAWEFARLATRDGARLATLHLASARSYERSGEPATAAESYLRIWTAHPLAPEADVAGERLEALERRLGRPLRTDAAWRKRGDALFGERRNEQSLEAYERALATGAASPAERQRVRRQIAETLFRLRRYPEAAAAYAALPQDAEIRIARARSLARSGRVLEGAAELERVGRSARGPDAAQAFLLAALLLEGEREVERARRLFEDVVRAAPSSVHAVEALWRLGWTAYQAERFTDARVYFEALGRREEGVDGLRARYWRARAAEREGLPGSQEAFAALASEYPLTYYGWRARERARGPAAGSGPRTPVRPGTSAIEPRDLERPRILLEAGLVAAARDELDRLFPRARGLEDRLSLAELYSDAGDFHRSQRLVVDAYVDRLARGPEPSQLELWWHAWPAPFRDEVRGAAARWAGLEPELIYALMREESGYRPEVVSVSGARGLLQLMPGTAERVARQISLARPAPDDLFDPGINIALGASYLGQLLAQFDGRRSAAIGSYNAGPQAVARWLEQGQGEDDEWVESIGYDQTRAYVKRVLRSLHAYRVLY